MVSSEPAIILRRTGPIFAISENSELTAPLASRFFHRLIRVSRSVSSRMALATGRRSAW